MKRQTSTSVAWNADTAYALGLCRMLTRAVGIWPLECDEIFAKIRVLVVAASQISMAVSLIRELMAVCGPFNQMVDFVALLACSYLSLLKVLVIRKHREKMRRVIVSAVHDWSTVVDADARLTMIRHACTGRFVFIFQMTSAYIGLLSMFFGTVVQLIVSELSGSGSEVPGENATAYQTEAVRYLPMGTPCAVVEMSTAWYAVVYVLQVAQLVVICNTNIGSDVFFFALVMHVSGQFELLNESIEKFGLGDGREGSEKRFSDEASHRDELSRIVERHNHLATLARCFEDTFSLLILAQLTASGLHISLLGIQFILGLRYGDANAVVYVAIALIVLNLQLFLYSYAGDRLSEQSETIRDAVYACPWYEMSPRIVKDLVTIIMRSDRGFRLTAGKIYPMNVYNFKNIVKAIASYFSFLKLMLPA